MRASEHAVAQMMLQVVVLMMATLFVFGDEDDHHDV